MKVFDYRKYEIAEWDNEVLGYVSQIHEFKGVFQSFEMKSPVKIKKLIEIAKIQSTEASNKIEGIVTTNTRIKQMFENKTTPRNRDEKEILGYRDVLNTIHESYEYIPIKSSYILQLHKDLYKYSPKSIGGSYKNVQNYITEIKEDGIMKIRFMPLAPYETPTAVENLCDQFNAISGKEGVDPLILIPIFILDFLCIHPFNDGNGRMSRLLTILLLYKFGYHIGKYISIEKLIEQTKSEYYVALQESSSAWNADKNNPIPFIKYTLAIILKAYRDFDERIKIIEDKKVSVIEQVKNAINSLYGKFYKKDIIALCPTISETSIEKALKQLLDNNFIQKYGERKATYYIKTKSLPHS